MESSKESGEELHVRKRENIPTTQRNNRNQNVKRRRKNTSVSKSHKTNKRKQLQKKRLKKGTQNRLNNRKIAMLVVGILVMIAIIFGAYRIYMYQYVKQYQGDTVVKGIYIEGHSAEGMSRAQLSGTIAGLVLQRQQAIITLITTEPEATENTVALSVLGMDDTNGHQVIEEALAYGKNGTLSEKYKALKALEEEEMDFQVTYKINGEMIGAFVNEHYASMIRQPVDSYLSFEGGNISASEDQNGVKIDIEKTSQMIEAAITDQWDGQPITIDVPIVEVEARIQKETLADVQNKLSSFTTYCSQGSAGRYQNVKRAADLLNGTVLMPGEEISVNAVFSPYTEDNGYANGGTFVEGQIVDALGGGICQVSSTTYNAVLYAELEVVKRANHSMVVSYVKPGKDAAIAGDYKDFVFKNNQETPIYIYGNLSGTDLTIAIYGKETRPENRSVELESKVIEKSGYGDPKFEENSGLSLGSINRTFSGYEGQVAELWKVVYVDGVETERTKINTSTYRSSAQIFEVGTKSSSSAASSKVQSAINSQDKGKIDSAIAEAKSIVQAEKDKAAQEAAQKEQERQEEQQQEEQSE